MRSGETRSIKDFLLKYKDRLRPPQASVVQAFCAAAQEEKIPLDPMHVSYTPHTRTIVVRHSGPLKNEILMRKQSLLQRCRETLGDRSAPEHIV